MRRKLPTTHALEAFDAAARHESFTKAAEELSVTQSAVCRQIASLEAFLEVPLFSRTRRGVRLTEAGLAYSRRGARGSALELAVVPTFGTRWLIPRLPAFSRSHPDITIHLSARTRPFLFSDTSFDAAIHAGEIGASSWPGTQRRILMEEALIAVASPSLAARGVPRSAADWARLPLLQQSTRPYAWRQFFERLGLDVPQALVGPRLELFSMLAEAAVHGMGVALTPRQFVEEEIAEGRLVDIAPRVVSSARIYSLVFPESKASLPALKAFSDWLGSAVTGEPLA
jgi:LysR family glycine cleavage system transcriptional activator